MLHTSSWDVVRHLGDGKAGLEKEGLRVTKDGFMARTRDPFVGDPYIVKDFSENQTEINTPVCSCIGEAVDILEEYAGKIRKTLKEMPEPEYLWPFSNPPYIRSEDDIPVAQYEGADRVKTEYRNYLAGRYGKYMMTFSGIHFNYSFSDELLMAEYEAVCAEAAAAAAGAGADSERAEAAGAKPFDSFQDFKNHFYVSLAAKALVYNLCSLRRALFWTPRIWRRGSLGDRFSAGCRVCGARRWGTGISLRRCWITVISGSMRTAFRDILITG